MIARAEAVALLAVGSKWNCPVSWGDCGDGDVARRAAGVSQRERPVVQGQGYTV